MGHQLQTGKRFNGSTDEHRGHLLHWFGSHTVRGRLSWNQVRPAEHSSATALSAPGWTNQDERTCTSQRQPYWRLAILVAVGFHGGRAGQENVAEAPGKE